MRSNRSKLGHGSTQPTWAKRYLPESAKDFLTLRKEFLEQVMDSFMSPTYSKKSEIRCRLAEVEWLISRIATKEEQK